MCKEGGIQLRYVVFKSIVCWSFSVTLYIFGFKISYSHSDFEMETTMIQSCGFGPGIREIEKGVGRKVDRRNDRPIPGGLLILVNRVGHTLKPDDTTSSTIAHPQHKTYNCQHHRTSKCCRSVEHIVTHLQ